MTTKPDDCDGVIDEGRPAARPITYTAPLGQGLGEAVVEMHRTARIEGVPVACRFNGINIVVLPEAGPNPVETLMRVHEAAGGAPGMMPDADLLVAKVADLKARARAGERLAREKVAAEDAARRTVAADCDGDNDENPQTFAERIAAGKATITDFDSGVERWHLGYGAHGQPLHDFLGMTFAEYATVVEHGESGLRRVMVDRRTATARERMTNPPHTLAETSTACAEKWSGVLDGLGGSRGAAAVAGLSARGAQADAPSPMHSPKAPAIADAVQMIANCGGHELFIEALRAIEAGRGEDVIAVGETVEAETIAEYIATERDAQVEDED